MTWNTTAIWSPTCGSRTLFPRRANRLRPHRRKSKRRVWPRLNSENRRWYARDRRDVFPCGLKEVACGEQRSPNFQASYGMVITSLAPVAANGDPDTAVSPPFWLIEYARTVLSNESGT